MNNERINDWIGLVVLILGGIVIFSFLYHANIWLKRPETYSADPGKEKILLARDEGRKIGTEKIIYKGLADDGKFAMAVVLLEMDPEYAYIHRIPIRKAKEGFSLVGHRFELISARRSRIRMWYIKKAPALAMAQNGTPEKEPWLGPRDAWGP